MSKKKTLPEIARELYIRADGYSTKAARIKHFQVLREFIREKKIGFERMGFSILEKNMIREFSH